MDPIVFTAVILASFFRVNGSAWGIINYWSKKLFLNVDLN